MKQYAPIQGESATVGSRSGPNVFALRSSAFRPGIALEWEQFSSDRKTMQCSKGSSLSSACCTQCIIFGFTSVYLGEIFKMQHNKHDWKNWCIMFSHIFRTWNPDSNSTEDCGTPVKFYSWFLCNYIDFGDKCLSQFYDTQWIS